MRIAFWGDGATANEEGARFVRGLCDALTRSSDPPEIIHLADREPPAKGRALVLLGGWLACGQRLRGVLHRLEWEARRIGKRAAAGERSAAREARRLVGEGGRRRLLLPFLAVGVVLLFVGEWAVTAASHLLRLAWQLAALTLEPITRLARRVVARAQPANDARLATLATARCDVLVTLDPTLGGLLEHASLFPPDAEGALITVTLAVPQPSPDAAFLRQAERVGEQAALCVSGSPEVEMDDLCWLFHIPRDKARRLSGGDTPQAWLDLFREATRRALWQKHCLTPATGPWPVAARPPARPRGLLEAFLFLQIPYRGGVWETVKDLLKDLAALSARDGRLRLTLGVHENQDDVGSLAGLPGLSVERFRLSPIRRLEMTRLLGHEPPWPEADAGHCFFDGAAEAAVRADCWLALVDRFSQPLPPLRPYGVFVYDMIQRRVPQSFSWLFFENVPGAIRPTLRRAERLIVTSPQTRDDVIEEYGIDPARVELIPVSCNPGRRFEAAVRRHVPLPGEPFLLNVTNISPHKGGEVLFRGFLRLRERLGARAPRLVICGFGTESFHPSRPPMVDTPELRAVRALIQETGLREGEDYVGLGMVSDGQLLDLFERAEVVVNPALYDNGTFSVVEAAWFGKKTVSAGYPASRYLCERYRVPARFFPPGDAAAFAEALEQALASPEMTAADVERVRRHLHDPEYSSLRYAERVYGVLTGLAEQGRRERVSGSLAVPATASVRRLAG
jgi:glycosyltransferase involved in cell wall biosynthesis